MSNEKPPKVVQLLKAVEPQQPEVSGLLVERLKHLLALAEKGEVTSMLAFYDLPGNSIATEAVGVETMNEVLMYIAQIEVIKQDMVFSILDNAKPMEPDDAS